MTSQSVKNLNGRKASLKRVDLNQSLNRPNKMVSFYGNADALTVTSGQSGKENKSIQLSK